MNYPTFSCLAARALLRTLHLFHRQALRRAGNGAASLALLGASLLAASPPSLAQIPQPGGSSQMERRSSAMGSTPDPAASAVHESQIPQSKDSGQGNTRGKTAGQGQKPDGAGGFNNGLYGTGAGSNK